MKMKIQKNQLKKSDIRKHTMSLNYRLISYEFDWNDKIAQKERFQHLIPISAKEITLINSHASEDNKNDPILEVIKRGALPEQFENSTYLKYQGYFPNKTEEPLIEEPKKRNKKVKNK